MNEGLKEAVQLAVVQTTQADHERRLAQLEVNYTKLTFWLFGTFTSSFVAMLGVIAGLVMKVIGGKP